MSPSRFDGKLLKYIEPGRGQVVLWAYENNALLMAGLDDGYPVRTGGYGGWEDEQRPGQKAATVYRGTSAAQLELRLVLGGWPRQPRLLGHTCVQQIDMLEKMAEPGHGRGDRPPLVRLRGPVPHAGKRWFVDDLAWGEAIVHNRRVQKIRVTVTLKEFVPIGFARPDEARRSRDSAAWYTVTKADVKGGHPLQNIARDRLMLRGSREVLGGVRRIRDLNGRRLRDPSRLRAGDRIKLPKLRVGA